jgi:hypothetical protein
MDFGCGQAHTLLVLRFRKPAPSFICFLLFLAAVGAATGHLVDAVGVAAFCFFVASIDGKPAWKYWFAPHKGANGRSTMARSTEFAPRGVPNKKLGERGLASSMADPTRRRDGF